MRHIIETASAIDGLLELAKLSLALGREKRITRHEDGQRLESVATHTVMLAWCALSLRDLWFHNLDSGEIARFALCHDAPKAICGDTPTLVISEDQRAEKASREAAALAEINNRTKALPWLGGAVAEYEEQKGGGRGRSMAAKCAAFVHAVDKMMPKLTHLLNGGASLDGISRDELCGLLDRQRADIGRALPAKVSVPLAALQAELSAMMLRTLDGEESREEGV